MVLWANDWLKNGLLNDLQPLPAAAAAAYVIRAVLDRDLS